MIGKTISHYKILEKLGGGGMGVVYKAEDTRLHRTVALKFLPPDMTRDEEAKKRFIHEAQAASLLQHNNICNIHDIDETEDGQIFICMDLYEGETLEKKIENGPLNQDNAINIITQIAQGLLKVHEQKIFHRDIKPANIFVTKDGFVKILDFGLAKLSGHTVMTKVGTTLGTAAYMSPEQTCGEEIDHRTDIWSLGVVLYKILTGELPFKSEYEQALVYSILNKDPKPIRQVCAGTSEVLEKITCRMLAKQLKDRYQSISELIADLESCKTDTRLSKKTRRLTLKRKTILYWGIAIGLAIAAIVVVLFFSTGKSSSISSLAVLPFINVANNPEIEYLCDGLTEALTDQLSHLPQLKKVTSFNGVLYFKGKDIPPTEIGKQLGVETLLITRLYQHGDSLTLNLELLNAKENTHLWGTRFDEALIKINKIPQAVFLSLVEDLHVTGIFDKPKTSTQVSEAYNLYLQARHYYHGRHIEDWRLGMRYYREAISLDPSFALAYSGMAESYGQLAPDEFPWVEVRDSAIKCATKAVELDNQLPQAYAALGLVKTIEADLNGAEQNLLKALALNPLFSEAYHYYAHVLASKRDHEKAVEMMQKAMELAPYSFFNRGCLAYTYRYARRWNEAVQTFESLVGLDSIFVYDLYRCEWEFSLEKNEFNRAMKYAILTSKTLTAPSWELEWMLAMIEGKMGSRAEALRHLELFRVIISKLKDWQLKEINLAYLARLYAQLGFKSEAIDLIESAIAQHAYFVWLINNFPEFEVLRSDPRFMVLLRRGGFID